MSDVIDVDDDFDAGFTEEREALTETPGTAPQDEVTQRVEENPAPVVKEPAAPAPEFAKITKAEYEALVQKASTIDSYKNTIDKMGGTIGGMKQALERLQSATGQGVDLKVSLEDFKEMVDDNLPDLAEMQVAALNRAFARLKASGAAPNGASPDQVAEIIKQQLGTESKTLAASLREEITQEIALDQLAEQHSDYKDVLNSPEFHKWRDENKITEKKDRSGVPFESSLNANFVGKILSDFKAAQKQAATRQNRLASAVNPKGAGGFAPGPDLDDEFDAGFSS